MTYLLQRSKEVVDLLIRRGSRYKVTIKDGLTGEAGDSYSVRIENQIFTVEDVNPDSDDSVTLIGNLQTLIETSDLDITCSVDLNNLYISPLKRGGILNVEVGTTDTKGMITVVEEQPSSYSLKGGEEWDQTLNEVVKVPLTGSSSKSVNKNAHFRRSYDRSYVRHIFSPKDYGFDDNKVLFFQVASIYGATEEPSGEIFVIMPPNALVSSQTVLVLTGTVPSATKEDAVKIRLPVQMSSFIVKNKSSDTLKIAFGGSDEMEVEQDEIVEGNFAGIGEVSLRTESGTAEIYLYLTLLTGRTR